MARFEATSSQDAPGELFIGLFWSILGTLVLGGLIALAVVHGPW